LQRKTYAFTVQNSRFYNVKAQLSFFKEISFTKQEQFRQTTIVKV